MIEYTILDNRYNTIINDKTNKNIIEKIIKDNKMLKIKEFKNYVNNAMQYWYKHSESNYILIFESEVK